MIIDRIDPRSVRSAIELASHAPSVHNTQPWHWTIGRRVVHLNADRHRRLPATDADGRDLTVSCGAALHHVGAALAAAGIRTNVHRIPNPGEPDRLATLELEPGTASEGDFEMAAAITRRRSDRRPFGDRPIPEETWLQVQNAAIAQGAILRPVVGPRARSALLEAIRQAAALQEDVPGYATELGRWSGHSGGEDGVPAANLLRNSAAGVAGAPAARRFARGDIDPVPARRADGAMLAVLGTASDDTLSQLRAGEALSSVLLTATTLGLASCPLSQPLEIGSTRHILRDHVLEGSLSPQLVLRLGWPPVNGPCPPRPGGRPPTSPRSSRTTEKTTDGASTHRGTGLPDGAPAGRPWTLWW